MSVGLSVSVLKRVERFPFSETTFCFSYGIFLLERIFELSHSSLCLLYCFEQLLRCLFIFFVVLATDRQTDTAFPFFIHFLTVRKLPEKELSHSVKFNFVAAWRSIYEGLRNKKRTLEISQWFLCKANPSINAAIFDKNVSLRSDARRKFRNLIEIGEI